MNRMELYKVYLKTPEAKVEKILDELDEERIKLEEKESKKAMRKIRLLARRAIIPLILFAFTVTAYAVQVPAPDPKDMETIGTVQVLVVTGEKAKELQAEWKASAKVFPEHGMLVLLQPDIPTKPGEESVKDAGMFDFVLVTGESAEKIVAALDGKDLLIDFTQKIIYHMIVPKRMNI